MLTLYPYEELGHANHGWLNARHHFSFASYRNANRMAFGVLRVINDDVVAAGAGFDTHPHRDMEIITYVRRGAITHKDSLGNIGRTEAGDVQVMSAGTGVFHSEYNAETVDTNLYQIWIEPNAHGVKPRWDAKQFPKEHVVDKLSLLVSGNEGEGLFIHQDATIHVGKLNADTVITHPIRCQAYILASEGELEVDGMRMKKGDGAEVVGASSITIKAINDAEILVIDVPTR